MVICLYLQNKVATLRLDMGNSFIPYIILKPHLGIIRESASYLESKSGKAPFNITDNGVLVSVPVPCLICW